MGYSKVNVHELEVADPRRLAGRFGAPRAPSGQHGRGSTGADDGHAGRLVLVVKEG